MYIYIYIPLAVISNVCELSVANEVEVWLGLQRYGLALTLTDVPSDDTA